MTARMMPSNSLPLQSISTIHDTNISVERAIQQCSELFELVKNCVGAASRILKKRENEVRTRSEEPVDVLGNGELDPVAPYKMFLAMQEHVDEKILEIQKRMKEEFGRLEKDVVRWKNWHVHRWVGLRPENSEDRPPNVEEPCRKVIEFVNQLKQYVCTQEFQRVDSLLRESGRMLNGSPVPQGQTSYLTVVSLVSETIDRFLVIFEHPPPVFITGSGNQQQSSENGDTKSKKGARAGTKAQTEKTKKPLRTTVGLLGGSGFDGDLTITDVTLGFGLASVLAKCRPYTWEPKDLLPIHASPVEEKGLPAHKKMLENLKLEKLDQKRHGQDAWQLIYHAIYFVTVVVQGLLPAHSTLKRQVLSFPFMVSTSASQSSEHVAGHLWHVFSARDVFDLHKPVEPSLGIAEVIQMLKERIRGISKRELKPYECQFLWQKLERAVRESGESVDKLTLKAFIKNHVTLQHKPDADLKFSLCRWFHSIFNLMENTLRKPWESGHIHGFISPEQCEAMLAHEPDGSFLLRFSESILTDNHMKSEGYLNTVVKAKGQVYYIEPIGAAHVKAKGLAHDIKDTVCQNLVDNGPTVKHLAEIYPGDSKTSFYISVTDPSLRKTNGERSCLTGKRRIPGANAPLPTHTMTSSSGNLRAVLPPARVFLPLSMPGNLIRPVSAESASPRKQESEPSLTGLGANLHQLLLVDMYRSSLVCVGASSPTVSVPADVFGSVSGGSPLSLATSGAVSGGSPLSLATNGAVSGGSPLSLATNGSVSGGSPLSLATNGSVSGGSPLSLATNGSVSGGSPFSLATNGSISGGSPLSLATNGSVSGGSPLSLATSGAVSGGSPFSLAADFPLSVFSTASNMSETACSAPSGCAGFVPRNSGDIFMDNPGAVWKSDALSQHGNQSTRDGRLSPAVSSGTAGGLAGNTTMQRTRLSASESNSLLNNLPRLSEFEVELDSVTVTAINGSHSVAEIPISGLNSLTLLPAACCPNSLQSSKNAVVALSSPQHAVSLQGRQERRQETSVMSPAPGTSSAGVGKSTPASNIHSMPAAASIQVRADPQNATSVPGSVAMTAGAAAPLPSILNGGPVMISPNNAADKGLVLDGESAASGGVLGHTGQCLNKLLSDSEMPTDMTVDESDFDWDFLNFFSGSPHNRPAEN